MNEPLKNSLEGTDQVIETSREMFAFFGDSTILFS